MAEPVVVSYGSSSYEKRDPHELLWHLWEAARACLAADWPCTAAPSHKPVVMATSRARPRDVQAQTREGTRVFTGATR